MCRVRLAELGLGEGKVLIDPGRSAWNPAVKREAWDELMDRLERDVSGGVIVFDLERFSRQPKDGERLIELAANGLVVLDSESEYDLRTANGKKAFRDAMNAAAKVFGTAPPAAAGTTWPGSGIGTPTWRQSPVRSTSGTAKRTTVPADQPSASGCTSTCRPQS